jgi:3-hydroxybutyryl-CoA dehydrogenase
VSTTEVPVTPSAPSTIDRIGVVGCGLMGSGIAEVCARAGLDVMVMEYDPPAAERGAARIAKSLDTAVRRNKLTQEERDATYARIGFTTAADELRDRQLVIEAVNEDEERKLDTFRTLDKVFDGPEHDEVILASNTSSIPIMKLAMATDRPEQVIGIHFFNPVPVLPLVELVPSLLTSASVVEDAAGFASHQLGKHEIRSQDRAGFVVNALLIPYLLSAIRMLESGFATAEHIDQGMVQGCAHPMGPLALTDLIGLDTVMAVAESMYEEFKEPLYAPPPMLSRMVDAGLLGRKSGRGFHQYT